MNLPSIAAALLLGGCATAAAAADTEATQCSASEKVVFSCLIGKKVASVCRPAADPHALVYRFGPQGHPELVYPDASHGEKAQFSSTQVPLFGGGETTLDFHRGDFGYSVYTMQRRTEDSKGEDTVPEFEDGIVVSRGGKEVRKLVCAGSDGFRESIDWLQPAQ